jgi:glycosyltransferase involved in cell wall biosynthesis
MISLICSTYNSAKWIDNYLNYVNSQFLDYFEIVFVDAKSTDGSLETIKNFNFREGINKKVIESKTRVGIFDAWNIGIMNSSYDYVMNYNTDDKLFPSALLTLSVYTKMYPEADVIYTNCWITDSEKHDTIIAYYNWAWAGDIKNLIRKGCCCGPFPLLKKKSVLDSGLFNPEFTISGDYEMWCRMNTKGYNFVKVDEMVGSYYRNPSGMSTDPEKNEEIVRQDTLIRQMYG